MRKYLVHSMLEDDRCYGKEKNQGNIRESGVWKGKVQMKVGLRYEIERLEWTSVRRCLLSKNVKKRGS